MISLYFKNEVFMHKLLDQKVFKITVKPNTQANLQILHKSAGFDFTSLFTILFFI